MIKLPVDHTNTLMLFFAMEMYSPDSYYSTHHFLLELIDAYFNIRRIRLFLFAPVEMSEATVSVLSSLLGLLL
jgi:hypothetical protein